MKNRGGGRWRTGAVITLTAERGVAAIFAENPTCARGAAARAGGTRVDESLLDLYDPSRDPREVDVDAARARRKLEQHRSRVREGTGQSSCRRLVPGATFELDGHPIADLNRRFVVTRLEHRGRDTGADGSDASERTYRNRFACLPADVAARPPRPAPRALRHTETAVVVGPADQEIHVDP